jgi:DNA repair exonuclease SbcCD ATPase subunit
MSMRLVEIILIGFGAFRERQSFRFGEEPGLYFLRGENRAEPRLGSNGAGKSTVWKALCWVLWGKTAQGLKAGEISSWGINKGTEVILEFKGTHDGHERRYFLKRTWKPNSWTLQHLFDATPVDLVKEPHNPVLGMLRLQFESFLHSIYMAQRGEMFLDMKPESKAQLFSSVMGLDRWLDYSAKASAAASRQDGISRSLEKEQAELKGRLEGSNTDDLQASEKEFEQNRQRRLEELEREHAAGCKKGQQAKQLLNEAIEQEERARENLAEMLRRRNKAFDVQEKAWKDLRRQEDALLVLKRDFDHLEQHWKQFNSDRSCSKCGRPFKGAEHDDMKMKIEEAQATVARDLRLLEDRVHGLKIEQDELESKLREADELHSFARSDHEDAVRAVQNARRSHELEERRLDALEEDSERVETERNPFRGMLQSKQKSIAETRDRLNEVSQLLEASYAKHSLYGFWVKGFKEIRLQLISEALDELEVEVNSELMALGLVDWELRFDVDAETKKGTLSRGFSVSVRSPLNKERVPWESWCGGEAQRLRLAAQAGLSNLIRSRTGCDLPLEVWDEPTESLSEEGIADLLTALRERAIREQRVIWIVDHNTLGFGGFDGTATVIKDEKGSRVVQTRV